MSGVVFDPKRHTKEWQEYMDSPEVVEAQRATMKAIGAWKERYDKTWKDGAEPCVSQI